VHTLIIHGTITADSFRENLSAVIGETLNWFVKDRGTCVLECVHGYALRLSILMSVLH
jgi:hypothetical protein